MILHIYSMNSTIERLKMKHEPKVNKGVNIHFRPFSLENQAKQAPIETGKLEEMNIDTLAEKVKEDNVKPINEITDEQVVIVDKTKENLVDPTRFLQSLRNRSVVRNTQQSLEQPVQQIPTNVTIENDRAQPNQQIPPPSESQVGPVLEEQPKPKRKYRRKTARVEIDKPATRVIQSIVLSESIKKRLPKQEDITILKRPSYYMNNREIFSRFIHTVFKEHAKEDTKEFSCESTGNDEGFSLLKHQKVVRDYINVYTPYRGLLLYHGLGSGKTCSSIAIAEGFQQLSSVVFTEGLVSARKVIVMTPASLRTNYFEELKKCGSPLYHQHHHWEFVNIREKPDMLPVLSSALHLSTDVIEEQGGAWLIDVQKPSNYDTLSPYERDSLDEQIKQLIHQKYLFINYNGLRKSRLKELTNNDTVNPFDNKVVIIDEAHNFVSRIVNKIEKEKEGEGKFLSTALYKYLLEAENMRIVLLTGTPMINYPNELGILFNMLRGYIRTWEIPFESTDTNIRPNTAYMRKLFQKMTTIDYIEVEANVLHVTRNPYQFVNKFYGESYKGVRGETKKQNMNHNEFMEVILQTLKEKQFKILSDKIKIKYHKALPDKLDDFTTLFIDINSGNVKNEVPLKRRILGLTSYFRSAQEKLLPKYDAEKDYYVNHIEMSDHQFEKYESARLKERQVDKNSKRKKPGKSKEGDLYADTSSSYRIFSRAFCNFVFPEGVVRPLPNESDEIEDAIGKLDDEDQLDAVTNNERKNNIDGRVLEDDDLSIEEEKEVIPYQQRIYDALENLDASRDEYFSPDRLEQYSPKFLKLFENINDPELEGSNLVYSQFRTLEGIGIFSLVLKANGYRLLKLKRDTQQQWRLDVPPEERRQKKMFALYTGSETAEEKEVLRNIFNGATDKLPQSLVEDLNSMGNDNKYGEWIRIFMITSSGAEGISLKNTRFVHIMEPYWHPVREEQVIGRARRICSHIELPEEHRNVKVFLYLMTFTDDQIANKMSTEIRNNDTSKFDSANRRPLTSDEALYEIMNRKRDISRKLLRSVKEAAVDCALHNKKGNPETLECYSFGNQVDPSVFSYRPNIQSEERDVRVNAQNRKKENIQARRVVINGQEYARKIENNKDTNMLYDLESYLDAADNPNVNALLVAKIVEKDGKKFVDTNV